MNVVADRACDNRATLLKGGGSRCTVPLQISTVLIPAILLEVPVDPREDMPHKVSTWCITLGLTQLMLFLLARRCSVSGTKLCIR